MDKKIEEIKDNGYQLLSITDEELRDASLKRQVFNNVNEMSNCVSFNPNIIDMQKEKPVECVSFNPSLIDRSRLGMIG